MSSIKAKLKSAKEGLAKKDYLSVKELTESILEQEPENYTALLFNGVANNYRNEPDASEAAYLKATSISPDIPTAWQGLVGLYEKKEDWSKLGSSYESLIAAHGKTEDSVKLAETIQKLIQLRRDQGTRAQIISALSHLLPTAPHRPILALLPPPTPAEPTSTTTQYVQAIMVDDLPILQEIVTLTEKEELIERDKEVGKRRMRIGGPAGKPMTKEAVEEKVFAEFAVESKLPELYQSLLNHPNLPLAALRETEHKLFEFHRSLLWALPTDSEAKARTREEIKKIAKGVVLIQTEDRDIWEVELEWQDWERIEQYPLPNLKSYVKLFSDAPLAAFVRGYLKYFHLEDQPEEDLGPDGKKKRREKKDEELLAAEALKEQELAFRLLLDGFDHLSSSLLAHRIFAQIHLLEQDYPNAISVCNEGVALLSKLERRIGTPFPNSRLAFQTILATSYVHYYSPKHHPLAEPLLEEVLKSRPQDTMGLIGKGFVLEAKKEWQAAKEVFGRVEASVGKARQEEDAGVRDVRRRALEEKGWATFMGGEQDEGREMLAEVLGELDAREMQNESTELTGARVSWKLGMCFWELAGDENRQKAYDLFLSSLRRHSEFAPSYTSLGIYYADHVSPPDDIRASRCFQRAFELDPREGEAARRLADSFADDREWELVEIIAKRTIDGEGGLEGGLAVNEREKEAKGRFLVENSWAWKALGAVELTRNAHAKAIHHFQIALRSEPNDISSWLRLSEAYAKSGKQAAALKTLARAQQLEPDNWLVTFMIGDVQTQLGVHQEAIRCFKEILETRPEELGVLVALSRGLLALAKEETSAGYHARAEGSLLESLAAVKVLLDGKGFRALAWKQVADVCLHLSQLSFAFDQDAVSAVLSPLIKMLSSEDNGNNASIPDVVSIRQLSASSPTFDAATVLRLSVCAYAYRHHLLLGDDVTSAAASHDIAVALHHFGTTLPAADSELKQKVVREAVLAVKVALRVQPRNEQLWVTLGTLAFETSARLSQHAFVMAIEINPKNPIVWSNLGFLYLKNDDVELASEAFLKSQTLDPDCSLAWLGQGIIASLSGHQHDSRLLFEHAVSLSNDSLLEANLLYAQSTYDLFATSSPPSTSLLNGPSFALKRFCEQRPTDPTALHLHALIAERLGQYDLAVAQITTCVSVLETAYELSEDPETETQFAIAQSNLGRLKLAVGDYQASLEAFGGTLGLVDDADEGTRSRRLRVHAKLGSGLANFWLGEMDESLGMFQSALDELTGKPMGGMKGAVEVLLAKALWSMGGEDEKEAARSTLFEAITSDPNNIDAVTTLASMGILSGDESMVEAAFEEVSTLSPDRRKALDKNGDIDWLTVRNDLIKDDLTSALSTLTKASHLSPSSSKPLLSLSTLHLQSHEYLLAARLAKAARLADTDLESGWEALLMQAVTAVAGDGEKTEEDKVQAMSDVRRAVMTRPWEEKGWLGLELVRSAQ